MVMNRPTDAHVWDALRRSKSSFVLLSISSSVSLSVLLLVTLLVLLSLLLLVQLALCLALCLALGLGLALALSLAVSLAQSRSVSLSVSLALVLCLALCLALSFARLSFLPQGLCKQNLEPEEGEAFKTTDGDLQGFWDLITIQIEELDGSFQGKESNLVWGVDNYYTLLLLLSPLLLVYHYYYHHCRALRLKKGWFSKTFHFA